VNVFELGHVYLQLVQALHLQLPLVDPAHHISRFAALLEFGADTARVAADAVRLVQRFDRDWLARGRRPAGVCGAALLLAARMNHFRRSLAEVVQVVKIADSTLQKRLAEFRATPSAQLSLADFRAVWLDAEMDPPAFTRGREREEAERRRAAGEEPPEEERKKKKKKKKRKRKEDEDEEDEGVPKPWDMPYDDMLAMQPDKDDEPMSIVADKDDEHASSPMIDPALLNSGILAGTSEPAPNPLFLPETAEEDDPADAYATPPATMPPRADTVEPAENAAATPPPKPTRPARRRVNSDPDAPLPTPPPTHPVDDTVDKIIGDDVSSFLTNEQGAQLQAALDDADAARLAREPTPPADPEYDPNWADGLDDAELDRFLLNEDEAQIKERVWVELNRDYLEALAGTSRRNAQILDGVVDEGHSEGRASGEWREERQEPEGSNLLFDISFPLFVIFSTAHYTTPPSLPLFHII
jgi:transcription factor IIIB subunit 2